VGWCSRPADTHWNGCPTIDDANHPQAGGIGFGLEKANAVAGVLGVILAMLSFFIPALDARGRQ
jgi:hypothetical protein